MTWRAGSDRWLGQLSESASGCAAPWRGGAGSSRREIWLSGHARIFLSLRFAPIRPWAVACLVKDVRHQIIAVFDVGGVRFFLIFKNLKLGVVQLVQSTVLPSKESMLRLKIPKTVRLTTIFSGLNIVKKASA